MDAPALGAALSALLLVAGMGGCAGAAPPQNTGTRMAADAGRASERADAKGALADQWKRGEKLRAEGERQVAQARRKSDSATRDEGKYAGRADKARADQQAAATALAEGEQKIAEGQRMKAESEGQFTFTPAVTGP